MLAAAMVPRDGDRAGLLERVQDRLAMATGLSTEMRQRLVDFAITFATLDLNKEAAEAFVAAAQRRSQRMLDLRQSGYAQMLLAEGEAKGKAEGKAEGKAAGTAEALVAIMEARCIPLGDATRIKILTCGDLGLLTQWLMLAIGGHEVELRQQIEALKANAA